MVSPAWVKVKLDFKTVAQDGDPRFGVYLELHGTDTDADSCVLFDDFRVWKTNRMGAVTLPGTP